MTAVTVRAPRLLLSVMLLLAVLAAACTQDDATIEVPPPGGDAAEGAAVTEADIAFLRGMIPHHAQALQMAGLVAGRTAHPTELDAFAEAITATHEAEIAAMNGLLGQAGQDPVEPAPTHDEMGSEAAPTEHEGTEGDPPADATSADAAGDGDATEGEATEEDPTEEEATERPDVLEPSGMVSPEDLQSLAEADGAAFDQLFLSLMITHHEGGIDAARQLLETPGGNADITALAEDILATQQAEVEQMRSWQEQWG